MKKLELANLEAVQGGGKIGALLGGIGCGLAIATGNIPGAILGCGALIANITE